MCTLLAIAAGLGGAALGFVAGIMASAKRRASRD